MTLDATLFCVGGGKMYKLGLISNIMLSKMRALNFVSFRKTKKNRAFIVEMLNLFHIFA